MFGHKRYVADSCTLFSYFSNILGAGVSVSPRVISIVQSVFEKTEECILIIPSVVFVELFDIFNDNEEKNSLVYYEIVYRIISNEFIEIKPLDFEVLETYIDVGKSRIDFENRDRIILATALALGSTILTSDSKIIEFSCMYPKRLTVIT